MRDVAHAVRFTLLLAIALGAGCAVPEAPTASEAFGWADATDSLTIVGDGVISHTATSVWGTAYTPDGDTLFFHTDDRGDGQSGIAMTVRTREGWTAPRPAPFETERYSEGHPSTTPGGTHIVFGSDRPVGGEGPAREADDFFRVSRASGWTDAVRMTTTDRISEKRASVAADGSVYYWTYVRGDGLGVYRGQIGPSGRLQNVQNADSLFHPGASGENNPYVDPQRRFALFAVWGLADGAGKEDLYLTVREQAGWSAPVNLGPAVNSAGSDSHPYVTPDGDFLFLSSDRPRTPSDSTGDWNHYVIRTDAVPALRDAMGR